MQLYPTIDTFHEPHSLTLIGSRGRMAKLYCPFIAFCTEAVGTLGKYTFVTVQSIRMTEHSKLVYIIAGNAYYHTHFRILLEL